MEEDNIFGVYLAKLRKEKGISLKQLSDGLCASSTLNRIENGKRTADRLLQNRFLTRLGMAPENYENFLDWKEYEQWEKRQEIVQAILYEEIEKADMLLEKYRKVYSMEEPLEYQFYLAMLVQIEKYHGSEKEKLEAMLYEAVSLTMPELEKRGLEGRVLSLEEVNLLLEYLQSGAAWQSTETYYNLLRYLERYKADSLSYVKIYPKAVWYFYLSWCGQEEKTKTDSRKLLELCNEAIEALRAAKRMFYLWELLGMSKQLVQRILMDNPEDRKKLEQCLEESRSWKESLEWVYKKMGIPLPMRNFCYLYVTGEVYCIADVVRTRRRMLGLTIRELSDSFCDERVVSHLEHKKTVSQPAIVRRLMEKLQLSAEFMRTELISSNPEVKRKYKELKYVCNNKDYEKAELLITELKDLLPAKEYPSNRQALRRMETNMQYAEGMLSKKEYVEQMKTVLAETIPYNVAVAEGEKYFSNEELSCIQNIIGKAEAGSREKAECLRVLLDMYERQEYVENHVRIYGFLMQTISSELGNQGEYDVSDRIKMQALELALYNRRTHEVHVMLYGLLWNDEERRKKGLQLHRGDNREEILNRCIQISSLCRDEYRRKGYMERLEDNSKTNL